MLIDFDCLLFVIDFFFNFCGVVFVFCIEVGCDVILFKFVDCGNLENFEVDGCIEIGFFDVLYIWLVCREGLWGYLWGMFDNCFWFWFGLFMFLMCLNVIVGVCVIFMLLEFVWEFCLLMMVFVVFFLLYWELCFWRIVVLVVEFLLVNKVIVVDFVFKNCCLIVWFDVLLIIIK